MTLRSLSGHHSADVANLCLGGLLCAGAVCWGCRCSPEALYHIACQILRYALLKDQMPEPRVGRRPLLIDRLCQSQQALQLILLLLQGDQLQVFVWRQYGSTGVLPGQKDREVPGTGPATCC